jgi:hypothetical protein
MLVLAGLVCATSRQLPGFCRAANWKGDSEQQEMICSKNRKGALVIRRSRTGHASHLKLAAVEKVEEFFFLLWSVGLPKTFGPEKAFVAKRTNGFSGYS